MKPLSASEQAHLDAYRWSVRTFPNTAQFLIIKRGPWWLFDTTDKTQAATGRGAKHSRKRQDV